MNKINNVKSVANNKRSLFYKYSILIFLLKNQERQDTVLMYMKMRSKFSNIINVDSQCGYTHSLDQL